MSRALDPGPASDATPVPLAQLDAGQSARIASLSAQNPTRISKLVSFGLIPGVEVIVWQRFPSFVIQVEETVLALEEGVVEAILVYPMGNELPEEGGTDAEEDCTVDQSAGGRGRGRHRLGRHRVLPQRRGRAGRKGP